ncbi:MAG: glutamate synthase-related protein, partial [Allosphingosinicella sp.]
MPPRRHERHFTLGRYVPLALCAAAAAAAALTSPRPLWVWAVLAVAGALTLLGLRDLTQPFHSVRRNYPVTGNFRWLFESIRPEIRQYLIEGDNEAAPFSRSQRSLVYARAKDEGSERAFGTQLDVYESGYEFMAHSTRPAPPADPSTFRIPIGNGLCSKPYSASIFNVSAMSFGSLSANAILALNQGAKLGGFAQDTGEGSISRYHREHKGDLIWELGSGYFGCRTADGHFDPAGFTEKASSDQVRMIE